MAKVTKIKWYIPKGRYCEGKIKQCDYLRTYNPYTCTRFTEVYGEIVLYRSVYNISGTTMPYHRKCLACKNGGLI